MKYLRRVFLSLGLVVLTLLVLFLINLAVHRLLGPSDAQKQALAMLAEVNARPARGDNAFALLWLMRYDVPDAQIETIAADDVRRAHALMAAGDNLDKLVPADRPLLPAPSNNDPTLCEMHSPDCLARVQANPEATRKRLALYPRSLQRARNLEAKGNYRNAFPATIGSPIPAPGQAQRLRLSELALAWQDGQHTEALAGTCRNISSWRSLRQDSDSLIASMLAVAYMDSAVRLFGDMLSALPSDQTMPADCAKAFAPIVADDVSMCSEMAGEFLLGADSLDQIGRTDNDKPDSYSWLPLVFNKQRTLAWRAEQIADDFCHSEVTQQALRDQSIDHQPTSPAFLDCAANMIGCMLDDLGAPAMLGYSSRLLDSAAHLRLGATLIWLRESEADASTIATRFAARPAPLRSGERASGVADDGQSIWVANLYQRHDQRFNLPLPAPIPNPVEITP